jgi:acyl carrier protein
MFALEDEFDMVFSEEELSGLDSVKAIIQRIADDAA